MNHEREGGERQQLPEYNGIVIDWDITEAHRKAFCLELDMAGMTNQSGEINVKVTSHGGDVEQLEVMLNKMDQIRAAYGVKINTIADGYCYSAGAVLVALGDKRGAYEGTYIMIHDMSITSEKETLTERRAQDLFYRKRQRRMDKRMADKMGKTPAEIRQLWGKWLDEKQALRVGLIDEIIPYK